MIILMRCAVVILCATIWTNQANADQMSSPDEFIRSPVTDQVITELHISKIQQRIDFLLSFKSDVDWHQLKLSKLLRAGDNHALIPEILQRLALLQDLTQQQELALPQLYSQQLEVAVKYFQQRHGLKPDGIIGPLTMKWINTSPMQRANLLTQNMIRQHQFFNQASQDYLLVNIPQFQLGLIEQGQQVFNSRVIVGKQKRPTPTINAQIKNVVLNPGWNVPRSIIEKDLQAKIIKNNNYLAEGNYEVFDYSGNKLKLEDYNWADLALGNFPYNLRQKPGPTNTLGRVKFYFDNDYSVYLHDTQNKNLFNRYQRTFSSGCVRVEKAEELAQWFAQQRVVNQASWRRAFKDPYKNKWLKLKQPLPIYLVYWTAWMDSANGTQFRTDIYERENGLMPNAEQVSQIIASDKSGSQLSEDGAILDQ